MKDENITKHLHFKYHGKERLFIKSIKDQTCTYFVIKSIKLWY